MKRSAVTSVSGVEAVALERFGAEWQQDVRLELLGGKAAGVRVHRVGQGVAAVVVAARALDAVAHAALHPSPGGVVYVRVDWRSPAGRRTAVAAVQRLVTPLVERRVHPARVARPWERDLGRAGAVSVTLLTDMPTDAERQAARAVAVRLGVLGVRLRGLPAPKTTWAQELARVVAT